MDTLAFLNLTLPAAPSYYVQLLAFPNGPQGESKSGGSHKFPSREHMAAYIAKSVEKGWDVYVSMAGFTAAAEGHYAAYLPPAASHQSHWVDLDCGPGKPYATIKDGLAALNAFLKAHPKIPTPLMVISGNGVHLYWPYDHAVDLAVWRPQAWALRQIMERAGLQIDGKCSIDPVRLLRPPGTANRKEPGQPKNVYCPFPAQHDFKPLSSVAMFDALAAYREQYGIPVHIEAEKTAGKEAYDSDLSAGLRETYSFDAVADSCYIADWHRKNGGSPLKEGWPGMHNATWMAVGAIYKFSDEGEALFHEHASQYRWGRARYSKREAQKMLNRIDHSGPRCETLANTEAERIICGKCKHRGQLNSPVTMGTQRAVITLQQMKAQLQQAAQQPQATAPPATDMFGQPVATGEPGERALFSQSAPPSFPMFILNGAYRHNRGVCAVVGEFDDGNPKLSPPFLTHFVSKAVRLDEADGVTQYRFEFDTDNPAVRPEAKRVSITLNAKQLGMHPGEVNTILLNNKIGLTPQGKTNHIMGYLHEWVKHALTAEGDVIATQMGFQPDGSFVLGKQRYKEGADAPVYLSAAVEDAANGYFASGTLTGWQEAARTMCEGGSLRNMQSLLGLSIAFGAPLMRFTDQHGALISFCTGESGRGKTTTGNLMSSVWGEPKRLLGNAQGDSPAHIYNHLARANTLPVLLDEATSTDAERIATLLNLLANGNAPGRANADGTNRRTLSWRTLGVTNTNHQISGKLSQKRHEGAGEQARLLEFMFDQSPMARDPNIHAAIYAFTEQHFGVAGPLYAKLLTQQPDTIRAIVSKQIETMRDTWMQDSRERMWIATMAAMLTGLALAVKAGIINWHVDFKGFTAYLQDQLDMMRQAYRERHQPLLVQMLDMLSDVMQKHGITVTPATQTAGAPTRLDVAESLNMPREIYARYNTAEGIIYISRSQFNKFAGENAGSMRQEAIRHGYMANRDYDKSLGADIMELDGRRIRYRCYAIDLRKMHAELSPSDNPATVTSIAPAS